MRTRTPYRRPADSIKRFLIMCIFMSSGPVVNALPLFTAPALAQVLGSPEPPRTLLDTTYSPPTGQIISVANGGDFQSALDLARPGDIIELEAGATFTGNFTLPNKSGTGWIYIRSSAYPSLPAPGTRVSPSQASLMAKIVSPNTSPAITSDFGAHQYRFIGIEITTTWASTTATLYNLILLGYDLNGNPATSLSQLPTDITFDRCYIHGTPTGNVRRGIMADAIRIAVIDSYLSDLHEVGADSQALSSMNGAGPFKIVNNELEGAGENVLFGGGDPHIANLVPSDIEIRLNHFFKPLSWKIGDPSYAGLHWSVKNILELKNAQRVLIEGNLFENNWADAQNGFSILFTVRNQDGTAPWSVVQDVTFRKNILRNIASAVNVLGIDNLHPSQRTSRILIKDNLFVDVLGSSLGGNGWVFQLLDGTVDVVIDHNTAFHAGSMFIYGGDSSAQTHAGFIYRNNIVAHNLYGMGGGGTTGNPNLTLSTYFPNAIFARNAVAGGGSASYPADNFPPATMDDVGFVNRTGGDYHLSASSPYKNAGTDGKDLGADIDAISAAINNTAPPLTDTTPPVISAVAALSITSIGAIITWATNEVATSQVEYGTTMAYGNSTAFDITPVTTHSLTLSGLAANTLFHYRVKSQDAAGNLAVSGDFTFMTLAALAASVSVSPNSLSFGSVTVGTTSVQQDVQITNTGSAGVSVSSVNIAGPFAISQNYCMATGTWNGVMAPGTHCDIFVVFAPVAGGNASGTLSISVAGNVYPVTLAGTGVAPADTTPPTISGVAFSNLSSSGASITWTTNEAADSQVEYGTTSAYGQVTALNTALVTSHSVGLSGLTASTLYHYRVKSRDAAGNLTVSADFTFITLAAQFPYKGVPFAVPGRIEAEDFDNGGEGVAYHDLTSGNQGGLYRTNVDVDIISPFTGVYVVNNFQTGEWLEYTINVAQAGTYRIEALVSSELTTSRWHIELDGVNKTGSILVPNTGWWLTFQWVGVSGVPLTAGPHILRIYAEQEYFNLDAIRLVAEGPQPVTWTSLVNVTANGNSLQKTSGCDGCQDAGAISQQQISSGKGYVEFTASETTTYRVIGLSNGNTDTTRADIDFAIQFGPNGGSDVRENGVYRNAETSYVTGDVFRIAVESGQVKYYKNGALFYTSTTVPTYPLLVDTSLWSLNGTITNAVIAGQ